MSPVTRRKVILSAVGSAVPLILNAQTLGAKSLKIVVPFSAGGPTDFIARQFAQPLARELGLPVIIENKAGASGNIGMQMVVDAEPNGLTLVHSTAAMQAVNPLMYPDAKFSPEKDLIPLGITGALPNVLVVHPNARINTIEELIRKGRQKGAELTFATFGPGSSPHIYGSVLRKVTGINAIPVAYKGSAHAITDMLAGHIDFLFDSMTTSLSHVRSGALKALAITSAKRSSLLPQVPTLKESGYGDLDLTFWFTLQAPAKTPKDMADRLRKAIDAALTDKAYLEAMAARGVEMPGVTSGQAAAYVRQDARRWGEMAVSIGIKPE